MPGQDSNSLIRGEKLSMGMIYDAGNAPVVSQSIKQKSEWAWIFLRMEMNLSRCWWLILLMKGVVLLCPYQTFHLRFGIGKNHLSMRLYYFAHYEPEKFLLTVWTTLYKMLYGHHVCILRNWRTTELTRWRRLIILISTIVLRHAACVHVTYLV